MELRTYSKKIWLSDQIQPSDIENLYSQVGITLIVNNRPDNEEEDQPSSELLEFECQRLGISYAYIPITDRDSITAKHVQKRDELLAEHADEKILFFCRSGGRSELLLSI